VRLAPIPIEPPCISAPTPERPVANNGIAVMR
jgi:hypothetical protein